MSIVVAPTGPSTPGSVREPMWSDVQGWFETIDAIIRGLGHGLNNRALALSATIESLDPKRPVGQHIGNALTRESERLTEQLRQLRALPFAIEREPMPLLLRDVLTAAMQLHRSHASLGDVPVYLEGSVDAPPVLAPESALLHATLVTLTSLKQFAAPGGLVRLTFSGTPDQVEIVLMAQRDPGDERATIASDLLVKPTALAAALLAGSSLEIDQRIGLTTASVTWTLPSLREMRRRAREAKALAG